MDTEKNKGERTKKFKVKQKNKVREEEILGGNKQELLTLTNSNFKNRRQKTAKNDGKFKRNVTEWL